MKSSLMAMCIACTLSLPARAANIRVTDAWARATVPGQTTSGAYLQIQSDVEARLIGVSSPAIPRVEMHEMQMDGDVMRMRELESIALPGGQAVVLAPGGPHLMLLKLKKPIAVGDTVPLTLVVESGGNKQTLEVKAVARGRDAGMQHPHHH